MAKVMQVRKITFIAPDGVKGEISHKTSCCLEGIPLLDLKDLKKAIQVQIKLKTTKKPKFNAFAKAVIKSVKKKQRKL